MKINKLILVSIVLLTLISLGAVSAASDNSAANDLAVDDTGDLKISTSDVDEITATGDDIAGGNDVNNDFKLGASASDDKLAAGSVTPNYTVEVTPDATDAGGNYIAQYGQIITVSGEIENATGDVSIRFGYSGNYHDYTVPLVDGKFIKEITDYDKVRNNYQIQVKWAGNDYYKSISWSKNIHVQMNEVTANGAFYGLTPYMDVNLFNATGNVTFTLNGKTYNKKLEDGKIILEFTNYTIGKNTVNMVYNGDDRFNPIEKSFTFTVDANVEAPTIYNYEKAFVTVYMGDATGKVNISFVKGTQVIESYDLNIVGGKVSTEIKNYEIGNNTLEISYSGDNTFNPFKTTKLLEVLDKEDAAIVSSVYQTANKNFIFISIPHATGTINVTVNGKKEVWELVNETAIKNINPTDKINELTVSYGGNVRLNPTTSSFYVNLTDYIVNEKTWKNYFNQNDDGRLYDFIEDGITLDFQGSIINPDTKNEMNIIISKPINVISSTKDAYIDLNTTAGSLLGEHPGSSFVVNRGGSGSNITGIYLHNTELWISNTTNVVFDNISVVVEDQRVGSGVGATSVRDNSSYVTLKNSYFYTRNNGGSTTFTFSWADHCILDNSTIKAEGNVGNLLYLNVYNIINVPTGVPVNTYNQFINNRLYGKEGSAISVGIMVEGAYNIIANNTLNKCSISTSYGGVGANNNIYYGNTMTDGSGLAAQSYSIVFNNNATGSLTTGTGSIAFDNTVGTTMTVTANSVAYNNTVGTTMTVAAGSEAYNNTVGGLTISGAAGIAHDNTVNGATQITGAGAVFNDNNVTGAITISGKNSIMASNEIEGDISVSSTNITMSENDIQGSVVFTSAAGNCNIVKNTINSSSEYAIDLSTSKNNVIKGNILSSANGNGKNAINNNDPSNVIEDGAGLSISVEDMQANQNETVVNVYINENATGVVYLYINGNVYPVKNNGGNNTLVLSKKDYPAGEYSVVAIYEGDNDFAPDHVADSFNVYYYDGSFNITVSDAKAGDDVVITVVFICENNASTIFNPINNLQLTVDGVEYSVPFKSNNTAVLTVLNISEGVHTIIASYPGENGINPCENITTFTIEKSTPTRVDSVIIASEVTCYAVDYSAGERGVTFKVTLKDANGNAIANENVKIVLDNEVYNVKTNAEGIATMDINIVNAGNYVASIFFLGNDYTNSANNNVKVVVKKKTTQLVAKAKTFKVKAKSKKYTATLKTIKGSSADGKIYLKAGKKVTLTVNKKTYTAKINKNGKVTFNLKKLTKKGKFKATLKFQGDNTYNGCSKKVTIKIK